MKLYTEKFVCFVYLLVLCVYAAKSQFHELAGAKEERKEIAIWGPEQIEQDMS